MKVIGVGYKDIKAVNEIVETIVSTVEKQIIENKIPPTSTKKATTKKTPSKKEVKDV